MNPRTFFIACSCGLTSLGSVDAQDSFASFDTWTAGSTSGTVPWTGFGSVTSQVTFKSGSDGFNRNQNFQSPEGRADIQGDLPAFAPAIPGIVITSGAIDLKDRSDIGYSIEFTFSDGAGGTLFPADSVFYIADVDFGNFSVQASAGGTQLNTSNWFVATAQTASAAFAAANGFGTGAPSTWDPASSTLVGADEDSTRYIHQFKAPSGIQYDTLSFEYSDGVPQDGIQFGIGNVVVVPEPSSALLGFLVAFGLVFNRRR